MARIRRSSDQTLSVLAVLVAQPGEWRHGYDLSRETGVKSGTLYPILMRLSDRGMLESKWESQERGGGRPPRHVYKLTTEGLAQAREYLGSGAPSTALLATPASGT